MLFAEVCAFADVLFEVDEFAFFASDEFPFSLSYGYSSVVVEEGSVRESVICGVEELGGDVYAVDV